MKKFFKKVMLFLGISTMTLTTTSCGVEDLLNEDNLNLVLGILNGIVGPGQTSNYDGTAECQYLYGTMTEKGFETEGQTSVQRLTCTMQVANKNNQLNVTYPQITVTERESSASMSGVSFSNLVMDEKGNIAIGDQSQIFGQIVAPDGNTYEASNAYIEGTISEDMLHITGSIYFGDDMSRVMNVNFTGKVVVAQ